MNSFTRALVSDLAPEIDDGRVDAAFANTFATLSGLGARTVDCRLEFRHNCK